jgi:hypothetical protein
MNSTSSPGTFGKRAGSCAAHAAFARSSRSREEATKFQYSWRGAAKRLAAEQHHAAVLIGCHLLR